MSQFDLVIRGGTIHDGRGGDAFTGDVAVTNGLIVEVGEVRGTGREEIDATGLLVTPGWVDIHTHYDGQATWDERITPSSIHGATTVVMGNCGVGFAPVRKGDHGTLIRLMEGVEDIPGAALHEGLKWNWESFPDYLDALDARKRDIDIVAQLPHGALRVYVMGERGANREAATKAEIAEMGRLALEAVEAGAIGFSTSRTMLHRTSDGQPTPTLGAAHEELTGIAKGLGEAGKGVLQFVSDFIDTEEEFNMLCELAATSGRPLSFSLLQNDTRPDQWSELLARLDKAVHSGLEMRGQVAARPVGLLLGLQGSLNPFITRPAYAAIASLPLDERVTIMKDPAFRAKLLAEENDRGHPFSMMVGSAYDKMFELGDPPDYEPAPDTSLAHRAAREGRAPDELVYDVLLADAGRGFIYFPLLNYAHFDLQDLSVMLRDPNTVPGLSDGGAHCGVICDGSFPTYMLTHWARDRARGEKLPLPWIIKAQSQDTARAVGLLDRGVIAPGYKADLNVIDFDRLQLKPPHMVYDLPSNARRLMQEAIGYVATIANGEVIYREGVATGALPGKLVRGHQKAPASALAAE
ncbi:MAG: amidohydrolase family protein [Rhizobiales bacterium]|nr:amidohydrolase family protein [Hyphomicrobiales bacterium]